MSGALGLAARDGWIAFNPALLARPPAQQSTTRTVPTAQEVWELLAAAAAEPDLELYLAPGRDDRASAGGAVRAALGRPGPGGG